MKPSEKIKKLAEKTKVKWMGNENLTNHEIQLLAIMKYLDEQYENASLLVWDTKLKKYITCSKCLTEYERQLDFERGN